MQPTSLSYNYSNYENQQLFSVVPSRSLVRVNEGRFAKITEMVKSILNQLATYLTQVTCINRTKSYTPIDQQQKVKNLVELNLHYSTLFKEFVADNPEIFTEIDPDQLLNLINLYKEFCSSYLTSASSSSNAEILEIADKFFDASKNLYDLLKEIYPSLRKSAKKTDLFSLLNGFNVAINKQKSILRDYFHS